MSLLLSPITIGNLELKNRIVFPPMCMYAVEKEDGIVTPFHFAHYGARAIGQVGLIILESTAIDINGRISKNDLCLWNNEQANKLKDLVTHIHYLGSKVGIQLNHAGRKAKDSSKLVAPSAVAFDDETPTKLSIEEIIKIKEQFLHSIKLATKTGVDVIELHAAHGYLLNQFLSPLSNKRNDNYGGHINNRARLLYEIVSEAKKIFNGSLWVRLSLDEYSEEGTTKEEFVELCRELKNLSVDVIHCSTGAIIPVFPTIPVHPGYQTSYAQFIKNEVAIPVATVGLIKNGDIAEYILRSGHADLVAIGRELIKNPNLIHDIAKALHDKNYKPFNPSYERGLGKI